MVAFAGGTEGWPTDHVSRLLSTMLRGPHHEVVDRDGPVLPHVAARGWTEGFVSRGWLFSRPTLEQFADAPAATTAGRACGAGVGLFCTTGGFLKSVGLGRRCEEDDGTRVPLF